MLKVDFVPTTPVGNVMQVTDTVYLQTLIRDSGALDVISTATCSIFESMHGQVIQQRIEEAQSSAIPVLSSLEILSASDQQLSLSYIHLCLDLVNDPVSASRMCTMGVANAMIACLAIQASEKTPDSDRVSLAVDLLWCCLEPFLQEVQQEQERIENAKLENDDGSGVAATLHSIPTDFAGNRLINFATGVKTLKSLMLNILFYGFRYSQKEVRNEIIILLTLLHNFPASRVYFITTGLIVDILTYACIGDTGKAAWSFYPKMVGKLRNFSTISDIDLQFKKELWILLADMMGSDDEDVIACIASSPFLDVLLSYLEFNSLGGVVSDENEDDNIMEPNRDNNNNLYTSNSLSIEEEDDANAEPPPTGVLGIIPLPQLRDFQVLAMVILAQHAHRMMGEFARINGPERTLNILCKYANSLNSDHRKIVYNCFLLLHRCLTSSHVMTEIMESRGAMRFFLYYFESSDDEVTKAQCVRNITVMCSQSELSRKQFRESKGIIPVVQSLNEYSKSRPPLVGKLARVKFSGASSFENAASSNEDSGGDVNILVVSILDCIWKSIVGSDRNEEEFAQKLGIDALFDVLEVSSFLLRRMILKLISDLFLNFKLCSFAYAWRSHKTMRSIGQILCHCWMDEEIRVGNVRDPDGVICNLWNVLGGHLWPKLRGGVTAYDDDSSMGSIATEKSATVMKLSTAIMASRMGVYGKALAKIRSHVPECDLRGNISSILQSLGFLEIPVVKEVSNVFWDTGQNNVIEDESDLDARVKAKKKGFLRSLTSNPNTFGNVGFVSMMKPIDYEDQNLSPTDKQVISMAMRYDTLREGEWWEAVDSQLKSNSVCPIEADENYIEDRKERLFEAARAIQFEQMELAVVRTNEKTAQAQVFIDNLLLQKNQQIKSEWIKKKSGKKY